MQYLNVFDRDYVLRSPATGIVHNQDVDYLRRVYTFNRDAIQNYYQERNFSVKNTHILSRIIEHLPLDLGVDTHGYLDMFHRKLVYLGRHFGLTSDIEKGVIHPPFFFGNDGEEILFGGYENFAVTPFVKNWKNECCVKVLSHPRDDDKMLLPLGTNDGNRGGFGSLFIDLPKLSVKWREFNRVLVTDRGSENYVQLTKNNFVIKYVLSAMMADVIDHTLLNKIMDRFYGRDVQEPHMKHRFKVFEPTTQVNRYVDNTLDVLSSKSFDFINALRQIKLVFQEDASLLLALPEMGGTRQVKPAVLASRIDHMVFLLDVLRDQNNNRDHINDWRMFAKRLLSDNSLQNYFSFEQEKKLREKLYRIQNH